MDTKLCPRMTELQIFIFIDKNIINTTKIIYNKNNHLDLTKATHYTKINNTGARLQKRVETEKYRKCYGDLVRGWAITGTEYQNTQVYIEDYISTSGMFS